LGNGTSETSSVPVEAGIDRAIQISCGSGHACVVRDDASVWCWGSNWAGQLGDGTREQRLAPTRAVVEDATEVTAGNEVTCAILDDGSVRCWGNNCFGAIGDGTTDGEDPRSGTCTRIRPRPTRVLLP